MLLVVEVANTSLIEEWGRRRAVYARAGISDYWIVDLREGKVETHSHPDQDTSTYRIERAFGRGGWLPLPIPLCLEIPMGDVLGDSLEGGA
jgi:Uma2 family endonuclease